MSNSLVVLPRPGPAKPRDSSQSISAPSEAAFIATFGSLLPRASYLSTPYGRAAYFELLPLSAPLPDSTTSITRVILLHGIQTPAIGLQPLASALTSRFPSAHFVLVDLWGHGLTDTPYAAHDAVIFHALLNALMGRLGWADAHFVGYSFGAQTTASFAAANPHRVASMVLAAPAGFIRKAQFDEVQRSYLRGGEGLEEQAKAWILELLEGGELVVPSDWRERFGRGELVVEAVRDWQMKNHEGHAASVVAMFRDGGATDNEAEFAKAAETGIEHLCILGELDDMSSVQDLHDVGMHNVVVIPQVGHAVVREKVQEVAQLIGDFWNKL